VDTLDHNAQDRAVSFSIGQEVIGQTSGAKAIVIQFSGGGASRAFQHLTGTKFSVRKRS
jgi:hypothetical protein